MREDVGGPRILLAAGTTETALIEGISAAGASPAVMDHTPAADAEIVAYGEPVTAPVTPVTPTGCVTPAAVTRAVREVVGFEFVVLNAGFTTPTAAPTVDLGADPGRDVRAPIAVSDAEGVFERARTYAAALPDDEIVVGETVPGGTTTALGVLTALGEPTDVSSSLPENPIERKRQVVDEALEASGLEAGECAGDPLTAIRHVGDPVQAAVLGLTSGAVETGTRVTLAGGSQQLAIAALARHLGHEEPLTVATTSFVAADRGVDLERATARLDCELVISDPNFDGCGHVAMRRYCAGEAKEGVAMGGALSIVPDERMGAVRERFAAVCARLGMDDARDHPDREVN